MEILSLLLLLLVDKRLHAAFICEHFFRVEEAACTVEGLIFLYGTRVFVLHFENGYDAVLRGSVELSIVIRKAQSRHCLRVRLHGERPLQGELPHLDLSGPVRLTDSRNNRSP